jgi:hypothetical protein
MRYAVLLALGLVFGCGGDDGGGGLEPPEDADVSGAWTASWNNLNSAAGLTCLAQNMRLSINQSGGTFTGVTNGGQFTCGSTVVNMRSFTIVNGTVDENRVAFDLGDQNLHQTGTVSGNSMSGNATWTQSLDGVPFTLNGTWSAAR